MKEYARTVVDNRTCILRNLDDLMNRKGLGPQPSVGAANVECTYALDSVFGIALDYKYIVRMVAETRQALEAYKRAAKEAEDHEVRDHAAATIPVLECDYQTAADLERELKTRP
jgi:predicted outer membrane protein